MLFNLYGETEPDFTIHMVYRMLRQIPVSVMLSQDSRDAIHSENPMYQIEANEPDLDPMLTALLHMYSLKVSQIASHGAKAHLDLVTRAWYILALLKREKPEEFDGLPPSDYMFLGGIVLRILHGIESNYYSYDNIPILPNGEADNKVPIGAAIAASLSFVNHACLANACVVWGKGKAKLIALRAIRPGEQVTITYNDVVLSVQDTVERGALIEARWGFM
jgi:hypothetical protein